ncbi:MAG: diphosphate--fructose-6-phosphate 1-phosphotransferase [Oscillospiraceae bacterium]
MNRKNALVALGGGPSPVINASLLGVVERCENYDAIDTVYGALHGIEGVLQEDLVNLSAQNPQELQKLRHTPASGAIGTCRYKLQANAQEDYQRIVDVIKAHNIGYFFYIGGNDSMDTAHKVEQLAKAEGVELIVGGVPKTIDNDLGDEARTLIDHTPGYGSVCRYWAMMMKDIEEENRGMCVSEPISVVQAMGRRSGFITAAARLADPKRETPLLLCLAETAHTIQTLAEEVNTRLKQHGRCIVVVNEGFDAGDIGANHDGFGHIEYGASSQSAVQLVINYFNKKGFNARGTATGQLPGVLQRSTSVFRSTVDVQEAYDVAAYAVKTALEGQSGYMATILRDYSAPQYKVYYDKKPLEVIANSERFLPPEWITPDGFDVTDDFIDYARPLMGDAMYPLPLKDGLQDFARLSINTVDKKCATYVPINFR